MGSTWEPIERVDVKVKGVDPDDTSFLVVEVTLSATPPGEWPHRFENPVGVEVPTSMRPPKVERSVVRFRVADDQLEEYVRTLDQRIAAANAYYEDDVLPARRAAEQRKLDEASMRDQRIADAQRRVDAL